MTVSNLNDSRYGGTSPDINCQNAMIKRYGCAHAFSQALPGMTYLVSGLFTFCLLAFSAAFHSGVAQAADTVADAPKVVVLGDSLVAGYGLAPGEAFPEQLSQALQSEGIDVEIENAGVSGDTTSGGLSRLDWSIPDDTDGVILELGANDALRGIMPEATGENLDAMIARLKERGIAVLLAGMQAPPNMGSDYTVEFNAIFPRLAEKYDIAFYPFFLDGVAGQPELNQSDGIHPTGEGVKKIVDAMLPLIRSFIGKL